MSVEYHASTVTNMDIEDSKTPYKQLLVDGKPSWSGSKKLWNINMDGLENDI